MKRKRLPAQNGESVLLEKVLGGLSGEAGAAFSLVEVRPLTGRAILP